MTPSCNVPDHDVWKTLHQAQMLIETNQRKIYGILNIKFPFKAVLWRKSHFPIRAFLKHKQAVCVKRKTLFSIFKIIPPFVPEIYHIQVFKMCKMNIQAGFDQIWCTKMSQAIWIKNGWFFLGNVQTKLIFTKNFISRNVKSAVKYSAAYKLNQHINGKKREKDNGWKALVKAYWASHVKCAYLLT